MASPSTKRNAMRLLVGQILGFFIRESFKTEVKTKVARLSEAFAADKYASERGATIRF